MNNRIFNLIAPVGIGVIGFYCIIGLAPLIPTNISWLRLGDSIYPYIGWAFFSNDSWTFPIGLNPSYGLDISSSIVYSDSIPILAIPFKAVIHLLPSPFQYFGIWLLICFIFQAWMSIRIVSLFTNDRFVIFLSSLLFIFFPPLIWRVSIPNLGTQAPVSSHFLILAAIYLNLNYRQRYREILWPLLLSCSALINFYFFVMCAFLWAASLLDGLLRKSHIRINTIATEILLSITFVLTASWQAGYFSVKSESLTTGEYGACGMNLLSLVSPNNDVSYLLPHIPGTVRCYEDSNYAGLGMLLLILVCIYQIQTKKIPIFPTIKKYSSLFFIVTLLAIFSLSNKIGIGTYTYSFSPPDAIIYIGGVLRQAGRMFWPLMYLIFFYSIYILCRSLDTKNLRILILSLALIQVIDTSHRWLSIHSQFYQDSSKIDIFQKNIEGLSDPFWQHAGNFYKELIQIPVTQDPDGGNAQNRNLSYAMKYGMGTNAAFQARIDRKKLLEARANEVETIMSGVYSSSALYIFSDEKELPIAMHLDSQKDLMAKINGVNVLAPGWKICSTCPQVSDNFEIRPVIPKTSKQNVISFSASGNGKHFLVGVGMWPILGFGWSFPEAFGTWSEGYQAKIVLPLPIEQVNGVELEMRALISHKHPKQNVEIWVNNQYQKSATLIHDQGNKILVNLFPTNPKQDYVTIVLRLPNKIKPKDLDLGDDTRELAIGLVSATWK